MKTTFLLVAVVCIFSSQVASAKQMIKCHNPEMTLSFNELDVTNLKETKFAAPGLYFTGNATEVIVTRAFASFIKEEAVVKATFSIPKSMIGKNAEAFNAMYTDITPESFTPRFQVSCSSELIR